jgi:hypothetical protein
MKLAKTAKRLAVPCTAALALLFAGELAAQVYQPDDFTHLDSLHSAPPLAMGLSGSSILRALDDERLQRLRTLEPFRGGKRAIDRFSDQVLERPKPWTLYGRLGVLNFQNPIEPRGDEGLRFTLRSTGPRLTGRIYIGIHREF